MEPQSICRATYTRTILRPVGREEIDMDQVAILGPGVLHSQYRFCAGTALAMGMRPKAQKIAPDVGREGPYG